MINTMINESFTKVGVNKLGNNFMALIDAQDLTNEYADVFVLHMIIRFSKG